MPSFEQRSAEASPDQGTNQEQEGSHTSKWGRDHKSLRDRARPIRTWPGTWKIRAPRIQDVKRGQIFWLPHKDERGDKDKDFIWFVRRPERKESRDRSDPYGHPVVVVHIQDTGVVWMMATTSFKQNQPLAERYHTFSKPGTQRYIEMQNRQSKWIHIKHSAKIHRNYEESRWSHPLPWVHNVECEPGQWLKAPSYVITHEVFACHISFLTPYHGPTSMGTEDFAFLTQESVDFLVNYRNAETNPEPLFGPNSDGEDEYPEDAGMESEPSEEGQIWDEPAKKEDWETIPGPGDHNGWVPDTVLVPGNGLGPARGGCAF